MLLLTLSACVAQNQSVTLQKDSIPTATIVPALQPAAGVRDTISENATIQSRMTRTERRTKRAEDYAFKIDSLIATRAFAFYPTLMQAVPGGEMRQVYANYFYAYISPVDLEVHLPTEYGMAQQMSMLNFDTEHIGNYTAVKYLTQWSISFLAKDDGVEYSFSLDVSTITGRSVLNVECPKGTMRYVGSIGERMREKR
jgi:hypothetical protein